MRCIWYVCTYVRVCVCACALRMVVSVHCGASVALCRVARYASLVLRTLRVALRGAFFRAWLRVAKRTACRTWCMLCFAMRVALHAVTLLRRMVHISLREAGSPCCVPQVAVYCMVRCEAHVAFRTGCCVEIARHAVCFFACRVLRVRCVFCFVVRDCVYCGEFRAVSFARCAALRAALGVTIPMRVALRVTKMLCVACYVAWRILRVACCV